MDKDRNQDRWRDANRHQALTQTQVNALPVGTEVVIVWSGGNGPHHYTISRQQSWMDGAVDTYVRTTSRRWELQDPVSFVGPERYHTHVVLAETEVGPRQAGSGVHA